MLKPLSAAALACVGLTLAGCSNPPVVIQSDPVIIEHEKTLDRVHNRDASVEFYGESRGGAAVRKNMAAHVLWNEHYEADAAALEAKRLAELENERLLEAERKAKAEAEVAKKKAQAARDSKDRSVYALKKVDRSIYARKKPVKTAAPVAKKAPKSPAPKVEHPGRKILQDRPVHKVIEKVEPITPKAPASTVAPEAVKAAPATATPTASKANFQPKPEVIASIRVKDMPTSPKEVASAKAETPTSDKECCTKTAPGSP